MSERNPKPEEPQPASPFRNLRLVSAGGTTSTHHDFTHSHAILIGINDYANGIQALSTATHDAEVLADLLEAQHGYQVRRVTTDVSKTALTELFTQHLPTTIQANDRLIVYFAGHGIALDGEDGPAGYLIPQDAHPEAPDSFLAMRDFNQWLSQLPCRHLLVILDCCFAGAFRWVSTRSLKPLPDRLYRERFERYIRDPAWQVLTSAAYDQKALDFLTGNSLGERGSQDGHSPFAQALFAALQGKGDLVPAGGDGVITATELYLYLRDFVEVAAEQQARHRQTPGLWPLQRHDKGEFIFFTPGQAVNLEPAPELTTENNPYRGLTSYDYSAKDARLFFGRNKLINELATLVEQHGLTLVLGASGTGKSSLVKAGLLPKLQPPDETGQVTDSAWHILPPIRPTDQPLRILYNLLSHELSSHRKVDQPDGAQRITQSLLQIVNDWCKTHPKHRLLLVIDQLEELITLCRSDDERQTFLELLAALLHSQPDRLRLVLTLRSDFEPQFAKSPLYGQPSEPPAQTVTRFTVPPLSQAELREVIEGPAAASTLFFEESKLVDDLINEVVQTPGALPLLSFTLEQLYLRYLKRQEEGRAQDITIDRALTRSDYQALGGVIGSLNQRASEEHDKLPDDKHRATLQRVMMRMVAVEGGELARRRVPLAELEYPSVEENQRVQIVLDRLVDARLLVRGQADADGDGKVDVYVEPAHDALVRAWDKLLVWKREADEYLPLQRRLTQAANEWARATGKAKTGLLWNNNPRLGQLQQVLAGETTNGKTPGWITSIQQTLLPKTTVTNEPTWLNQRETKFVQTSVNRRASVLRQIVGITGVVILALTLLSIFANNQRISANQNAATAVAESNARATEVIIRTTAEANAVNQANARATQEAIAIERQQEAERQARIAISRQLAAESRNELSNNHYEPAILLAIEAGRVTDTLESFAAIRAAIAHPWHSRTLLQGHTGSVSQATWSQDESKVLTGSNDGSARIWDVATGKELVRLEGHTGSVTQATWSQDESKILTHSEDGTARIWDAISGKELVKFAGQMWSVTQTMWSADESKVLARSDDGTARIWDAITGEELLKLKKIYEARWSADESKILTTSDNVTVRIWDAVTGKALVRLVGHMWSITNALWSQDESKILTSSGDNSARIWDAATGEELVRFEGHTESVIQAIWNRDESKILTRSDDGTVRLWDAATGKELFKLEGHTTYAYQAIWNQDESKILTSGVEGIVRIWDAATGKELVRLEGHTLYVYQSTWSEDESKILTRSGDGTVRVWDAVTGKELIRIEGVHNATWSQDESKILTTSEDGALRIWDVSAGKESVVLEGHTRAVRQATWSKDKSKILTRGSDVTMRIWEAATGKELVKLEGHMWSVDQATWSRDESKILTRSEDDTARIWDASTGKELVKLEGHTDNVWQATWNADESKVLTHSPDNTARIWDATTGKELVKLEGHTDSVWKSTWSTDESKILTYSHDRSVRIWDAVTGKELVKLDGVLETTWSTDKSKILTLNQDSTARIWDAATGKELVNLEGVIEATWSADENKLLTRSGDNTVRIWDSATGEALLTLAGIIEATWNADERKLLTRIEDKSVRIWDAVTGKELVKLAGSVEQATWSVGESKILTSGGDDIARIWDATTGRELVRLEGYIGNIWQATWSVDENKLLTNSGDGSVRIWDAATGKELVRLDGVLNASWIADESKILTLNVDGTVRIWFVHMQDLFKAACRWTPRNLNKSEWGRYMEGAYRPTCSTVILPLDVINTIHAESSALVQQGAFVSATQRIEQLNGWLKENGQWQSLGVTPAQFFREQAAKVARRGEITAAVAGYQEALRLDPTLSITPAVEANREYALVVIIQADQLARRGEITAAVAGYQEALRLDPTLLITPVAEANRHYAPVVVEQAAELARSGEITAAVARYQEALRLDPTLLITPVLEANRQFAPVVLEPVVELARSGEITASLAAISQSLQLDPNVEISAKTWNEVCWEGALAGLATQTITACENAVAAAPEDGGIRDSRGLARALVGDLKGAIEDFEFFVQWAQGRNTEWREAWIDDLKAGKNPFTEEVLRQLRGE